MHNFHFSFSPAFRHSNESSGIFRSLEILKQIMSGNLKLNKLNILLMSYIFFKFGDSFLNLLFFVLFFLVFFLEKHLILNFLFLLHFHRYLVCEISRPRDQSIDRLDSERKEITVFSDCSPN